MLQIVLLHFSPNVYDADDQRNISGISIIHCARHADDVAETATRLFATDLQVKVFNMQRLLAVRLCRLHSTLIEDMQTKITLMYVVFTIFITPT